MCNDDTPMVRKAAFTNMGSYAMVVEKSLFKADILPIIKTQIAEDDSDTMRTFAIDCWFWRLGEKNASGISCFFCNF